MFNETVFSTKVQPEINNEPNNTPKQEIPIEQNQVIENKEVEIMPPVDKYAEVKGKPYTVDYLNIEFYEGLTPETDVNNIIGQVKKLDDYIIDIIKRKNLNNTVDSYCEVMEKIKQELSISENELLESKLSRIINYIEILNRNYTLEQEVKKYYGQFSDTRKSKLFI